MWVALPAPAQQTPPANAGAGKIAAFVKEADSQDYATLTGNKAFRVQVLRWKLEQACPNLAAMAKGNSSFMGAFGRDEAWMEGFLGSGPLVNGDRALELLATAYKHDSSIARAPLYKKLATALALEFARQDDPKKRDEEYGWNEKNMLARYDYYKTSHRAKLLNRQFDKLDYWDMRIIAGRWMNQQTDPKTLAWLRDNYHLPAQDYVGVCWACPYRLHNAWGESIHGRDYYIPFNGQFSGGWAQMTRDVGAVCGGLSTFGTIAALANGVPAITMGEPGHCAYAVRVSETEWKPAYSLSWKRDPHWSFFKRSWAAHILTQDTYSDAEKLKKANYLRWTAEAVAKQDKELARKLYREAIKAQPVNYDVWNEYLAWEGENKDLPVDQLKELTTELCAAMAGKYSAVAWDLLNESLYPMLMPKLTSFNDRLAELRKFHSQLGDEMSPIQWDYEGALSQQLGHLNTSQGLIPFVDMLVACHYSSKGYAAPSMVWCYDQVYQSDEDKKKFFALIEQQSKGTEGSDSALKGLANTIVRNAEQAQDMGSFQSVGALLKDQFTPSLPEFEAFPGELLSSGGILQLSSSSSRWGEPWKHWGVLETCGGHFHTDNDDPATVMVTMPRIGDISGIVIVFTGQGHLSRCNNTVIEVSPDGQAWTEVGKIEKMQVVNRIDLQSKTPRAQYVRLTRNGKEVYHLNAILIYGKRAA